MAQFTAPDLNTTRVSVRQEFEVEVEQPPRMDQIHFTTKPVRVLKRNLRQLSSIKTYEPEIRFEKATPWRRSDSYM